MAKKIKSNKVQSPSILNYTPPSLKGYRRACLPLIKYFDPQYHNFNKHNCDQPTLFVANHSIMSIADILLPYGIYQETGDYVRPLGDRLHFNRIAPHRTLFIKAGVVLGTRDNVRELMDDRQSILVFPGGIREVLKRRDEKYTLQWKKRIGFVSLALEKGYTITPIGVVGGDDIFNILMDANDVDKSLIGRKAMKTNLAQKWLRGGDMLPPILKGVGLSVIPKPQQLHFNCGSPIDISDHREAINDKEKMLEVRDIVSTEIYRLLEEAQALRTKARSKASFIRRTLT